MKKAFLFLMGAAALCFGLFLLFVTWPDLNRHRLDTVGLTVLGVTLTLPIAGAVLMAYVIRAWRQPDGSPGKWARLAFYLVVLDMSAALVLPIFVKPRTTYPRSACFVSQLVIHTYKQQWAMENKMRPEDTPTQADLIPYFKDKQFPACHEGGTIIIGTVAEETTCTYHTKVRFPGVGPGR